MQVFDAGGRVANWDGYQGMLEHLLYKQLGWPAGDEGYLLLTENSAVATRTDRERTAQLAFEAFNVRGLYVLDTGVAAVYAAGGSSGVAVDIGLTGTTITQVRTPVMMAAAARRCTHSRPESWVLLCTPTHQQWAEFRLFKQCLQMICQQLRPALEESAQVQEGLATPGAQLRLPVGGALLDTFMQRRLHSQGLAAKQSSAALLKEKCIAVAESADKFEQLVHGENSMEAVAEHELPDGSTVQIGTEGCVLLVSGPWLQVSRAQGLCCVYERVCSGQRAPQHCICIAAAAFSGMRMRPSEDRLAACRAVCALRSRSHTAHLGHTASYTLQARTWGDALPAKPCRESAATRRCADVPGNGRGRVRMRKRVSGPRNAQ